jgi:hypothetical protein
MTDDFKFDQILEACDTFVCAPETGALKVFTEVQTHTGVAEICGAAHHSSRAMSNAWRH